MRDTAAVLVLSGADEVGESARVEVMAGEVIPLEVMALEVMAGQESVLTAAPVDENDSSRKQYSSSSTSPSRLKRSFPKTSDSPAHLYTCIYSHQRTQAATQPLDHLLGGRLR